MVISDNKLKEKVWNTDKELNGWLLPGGYCNYFTVTTS